MCWGSIQEGIQSWQEDHVSVVRDQWKELIDFKVGIEFEWVERRSCLIKGPEQEFRILKSFELRGDQVAKRLRLWNRF